MKQFKIGDVVVLPMDMGGSLGTIEKVSELTSVVYGVEISNERLYHVEKFKVGHHVEVRGYHRKGQVIHIDNDCDHPVVVRWVGGARDTYTLDGRYLSSETKVHIKIRTEL